MSSDEHAEDRRMVEELLDLEHGLTAWEVDFIESLDRQSSRPFTDKQRAKLHAVYQERMP